MMEITPLPEDRARPREPPVRWIADALGVKVNDLAAAVERAR
jgi:hypothetical protein